MPKTKLETTAPVIEEPKGNVLTLEAKIPHRAVSDRREYGKSLRNSVPREAHAGWKAPHGRRDPVDLLVESNQGRLPQLIPIRFGRMMQSPFTFYRGSAGLMAADLATTPVSGLSVQACGDAASAEFRRLCHPRAQHRV